MSYYFGYIILSEASVTGQFGLSFFFFFRSTPSLISVKISASVGKPFILWTTVVCSKSCYENVQIRFIHNNSLFINPWKAQKLHILISSCLSSLLRRLGEEATGPPPPISISPFSHSMFFSEHLISLLSTQWRGPEPWAHSSLVMCCMKVWYIYIIIFFCYHFVVMFWFSHLCEMQCFVCF